MKKIYKLIVLSFLCFLNSCTKNDVFTGSPVNSNLNFETLHGTINCDQTQLSASQLVKVTVTIPKAFDVDVLVENSAFIKETGKRTRKSVIIPAGTTSVEMMMPIPGGDQPILPFLMNVNMYLTAITTAPSVDPKGFVGMQYSIDSNILTFGFGDTSFATVNSKRCGLKFDFANPNAGSNPVYNNLDIKVSKNGGPFTVANISSNTADVYGTYKSTSRYESIYFNNSGVDATYVIEIYAQKLISSPLNVPFRFTVRYPSEETEVFTGVLNNAVVQLPAGSNSLAKLEVKKTTTSVNGDQVYKYEVKQF